MRLAAVRCRHPLPDETRTGRDGQVGLPAAPCTISQARGSLARRAGTPIYGQPPVARQPTNPAISSKSTAPLPLMSPSMTSHAGNAASYAA